MTLLPLIRKLKEAREPSRELDADIFELLGGEMWDTAMRCAFMPSGCPDHIARIEARQHAPRYTASVEAAFLLLRKHYMWRLKRGIECEAIVWWLGKDWDDTGAPTARQLPEYPALALTTAILIARAVEGRELHPGDEI